MGQTLTHGVYLPNEGERNCYSGLASNWRLLDGAIGTVAAHTTAIAGKADISHTHGNITNDGKVGTTANLPLITGTDGAVQAGSFGNSANTFCEGNDSRLSDARTPVAHTHTKSDVADLLNSNFIPSANNSYDLGSSSYQWNNLYAKNYYYNGVAWGLDKANVWSAENTYTASNLFRKRPFTLGNNSYQIVRTEYKDTNDARWGVLAFVHGTDNSVYCDIGVNCLKNDGQTVLSKTVRLLVQSDNNSEFKPINDQAIHLGTSTFRWKTFNGINPGALSLPNFDSDGYTDLSSNLTENVQYSYTPVVDGWLALFAQVNGFHAENAVGIFNADTTLGNDSFRWANTATAAINLSRQTGKYYGSVILPVRAGYPYYCWLRVDQSTTLGLKKLIFYKAKGNV